MREIIKKIIARIGIFGISQIQEKLFFEKNFNEGIALCVLKIIFYKLILNLIFNHIREP